MIDGRLSTGTAFFFAFQFDAGRSLPLLVTNKHVVKGATTARFHLHEAVNDGSGKPTPSAESFLVTMNEFEQGWFNHPDPEVDLCVMAFEPLRQAAAKANGKEVYYSPLTDALVLNEEALSELSALEDVTMVGYPIGLWDSFNNLPILRRGITASHPATMFQGKPQGVVDMACFPGSSGSPILIVNEGSFTTSGGFTVGSRVYFLGVLFAGPVHAADGTIQIVEIPTVATAVSVTTIPIHLGYYVKAAELLKLKPMLLANWKL